MIKLIVSLAFLTIAGAANAKGICDVVLTTDPASAHVVRLSMITIYDWLSPGSKILVTEDDVKIVIYISEFLQPMTLTQIASEYANGNISRARALNHIGQITDVDRIASARSILASMSWVPRDSDNERCLAIKSFLNKVPDETCRDTIRH